MGNIGTITGTGEILQSGGGTSKHICRLAFSISSSDYPFRAAIIVPKSVQTLSDLYSYIRNNSDYSYSQSSVNYYFKAATVYYCGPSSYSSEIFQCLVVVDVAGSKMYIKSGSSYSICLNVTATFEDL